MDTKILKEILEAPDGFSEVRRFCEEFEGYREAKAVMDIWNKKLENLLGKEEYYQLEAAIARLFSFECQAYYVFGLRLREELKRALML